MGWIFVVCWKYDFMDHFLFQTSDRKLGEMVCFVLIWLLLGWHGWLGIYHLDDKVHFVFLGPYLVRVVVSFPWLWWILICYSNFMMLFGSDCIVSALQRYRCRLCRSCICDQIYRQDPNHSMSCFESSLVFLTHASWSLQGPPDVRRYGPRWLAYV